METLPARRPLAEGFALVSYPCAICNSLRRRVILRKHGRLLTCEFQIVRCEDCGHVYVNPRVADADIPRLYDEAYFQGLGFDPGMRASREPDAFKRLENDAILETVSAAVGGSVSGKKWLDFACGPGHLVASARDHGARAVGCDGSEEALRICRERDLPAISEAELARTGERYDIVTAIEVIEHVSEPRAFLAFLKTLLAKDGILFVQTGNWDLAYSIRRGYIMPEGHIQYFSPPIMKRLFREVGLDEAPVFNRSWFAFREIPQALRGRAPLAAFELAAAVARRIAPRLAPFPVGRLFE